MSRYLLIILFFTFNTSFGCTCINLRPLSKKELRAYDIVAKARILNVDTTSGRDKKILIEIIELYKGKLSDTNVVIITEFDPGMCGIDPKINETWLMYSFKRGDFNYTDLCTKSKIIKSDLGEDKYQMKELRRELRILEKNKKRI